MLGRKISSLESHPRRLFQALWGISDIHTRQKWQALWPHLRSLQTNPLLLLDAGCGYGRWSLELALRRPTWEITGIDADAACLRYAEAARKKLRLSNARFEKADFFAYAPAAGFDAVLSVCSAHTSAEAGKGNLLFQQFHRWLNPNGKLFLLVPRRFAETPFIPWLPRQHWQQVFARGELVDLCLKNGFAIEVLSGRVGRLGTLAKQIDLCLFKQRRHSSGFTPAVWYPLVWFLALLDRSCAWARDRSSLFWLLIARKEASQTRGRPITLVPAEPSASQL